MGHRGDLYERQAPPRRKSHALQLHSRLYPRSLDSSSGASSRAGTETTTVGGGNGMDSSWRTSTELSGESRINSALSNGHNGRAATESTVPRLPSIPGAKQKGGGGGRGGGQASPGLDRVKRHLARVEDGDSGGRSRNAEDGIYVIGVSD